MCPQGRGGSSPLIRTLRRLALFCAAALAAVSLSGGSFAAVQDEATTEVVVTLAAPPLSAFGAGVRAERHRGYVRRIAAARAQAERNVLSAVPGAKIRWRYHVVLNGFAVVLPSSQVSRLARIPGIAAVWPGVTYHRSAAAAGGAAAGPGVIGADKLWGAGLATAGNGIKIGIIDDGLDASHPFFSGKGMSYPAGFPKGQTRYTTPKVIVQRTFPPPEPDWKYAARPLDPTESFHATHVAGIAAGDHGTRAGRAKLSGVAPRAYLGNYKALTIPTPDFGLDGNAPEIAAAIETAVADGMDVINLSLGEPEVEPSRDIVVAAIEGAARAGVVPVVSAGNDFGDYGFGTVGSPGSAPSAITVAAVNDSDVIAGFSSAGPTPVSLRLKPDVAAPGVGVTSSLPRDQGGPWGVLQGTSMASPHVSGGVALLKQRHPSWTVAQIKSALVQTADPVHTLDGREASTLREGGGVINLPRALDPLLFAAPSSVTFPVNGGMQTISLTDAGGGAGSWSVSARFQGSPRGITIDAPATAAVPGELEVTATATASAGPGPVTGFLVLRRGEAVRRIPFLLLVNRPLLGSVPHTTLGRPGTYTATTRGGTRKILRYRYPSAGGAYPGPEVVYRVRLRRPVANFGVVVLAGRAVPHVVYGGDENHLTGYPGMPVSLNPYFATFGERRPIAGAVLPGKAVYDIVFDTPSVAAAGRFRFRYWIDDTRPPRLRLAPSPPGTIRVAITDAGSGVDPRSVSVMLDGRRIPVEYADGHVVLRAARGRHSLVVRASDYQETKNMENVPAIRPNTATLSRTVTVR